MASPKHNPLRRIGEQLQSMMPMQILDSQKQMREAKVIESLDGVPDVYREFFRLHLSQGEAFPYTVTTPAYEISADTVTGKLVCAIEHALYVLEQNGSDLSKTCYPIDEILYVEVVHRPPTLHVKLHGLTHLGLPSTSAFGCSRSTSRLLAPLLRRMRLRIVSLNEKAPSRHMERLDRWNVKNTQVVDMARHCLMSGETVIESILQAEIHSGIFSADRAFRGAKGAAHLCILTDKELVMIREDLSFGKKNQCGMICHFVPLNKIQSLTVKRENENLLAISIRILNGEIFESLFDLSLENAVNQFLERTRELMPKERMYIRD